MNGEIDDEVESRWFKCVVRESLIKGNRYPWNIEQITGARNEMSTPSPKAQTRRSDDTPVSRILIEKQNEISVLSNNQKEEHRIRPYNDKIKISYKKEVKSYLPEFLDVIKKHENI
jgi:hypothetical protein